MNSVDKSLASGWHVKRLKLLHPEQFPRELLKPIHRQPLFITHKRQRHERDRKNVSLTWIGGRRSRYHRVSLTRSEWIRKKEEERKRKERKEISYRRWRLHAPGKRSLTLSRLLSSYINNTHYGHGPHLPWKQLLVVSFHHLCSFFI